MKTKQEILEMLVASQEVRKQQGSSRTLSVNAFLAIVQLVEETRIEVLKSVLEM